jgi:archaellum biogenesis protein FlaJ (TadC family)
MIVPEIRAIRSLAATIIGTGLVNSYLIKYEQCRIDQDFPEFVYRSCLIAGLAGTITLLPGCAWIALRWTAGYSPGTAELAVLPLAVLAAFLAFCGRLYWITSLRDYRSALIDSSAIYAVGLMVAMTGYDVPIKRIFRTLSSLGHVYSQDIALEATYVLSLAEEDGLDMISAMRKAQSTSPSRLWKELLIGIIAVYGSGGSLRDYLRGRYESLAEKKALDIRRYNETARGISSIYLTVIGIGAIFVAIINLVFNMAGMMAGDALVWIDALVIVPLGSLVIIKALQAGYPEAMPC